MLTVRDDRFQLQDVAVEVAQGSLTSCNAHEENIDQATWTPNNDWDDDHGSNPAVGRSIGIVGSRTSGTLGFYIRIREAGYDDRVMAATCHHVVAPDGGMSSAFHPPFFVSRAYMRADPTPEEHAAPINIRDPPVVIIESPSPCDQLDWDKFLQEDIEQTNTMKDIYLRRLERQGLSDELKLKNKVIKCDQDIATFEKQKTNSCTRMLGKVFRSSGLPGPYDEASGKIMFAPDWALITLDPERFPDVKALKNVRTCKGSSL